MPIIVVQTETECKLFYGDEIIYLPLSSIRYADIVCGTKSNEINVEDTVHGIVEVALSLRRKYHPLTIVVCGLFPRHDNWSVNRK